MAKGDKEEPKTVEDTSQAYKLEPITVQLLEPLDDGKNKRESLTFRPPTGGDIVDIGNPVHVNPFADRPMETMKIDDERMFQMMGRLATPPILPPLLRRMNPHDFATCSYSLIGFFLPMFRSG